MRELAGELFAEVDEDPLFDGTRFILEPGRFLAGPAGVYLGRVNTVKVSRGRKFAILDAGMHHQLAASGNLGQVIKRDYPILFGTLFSFTLIGLVMQLVGDLTYVLVDPRIDFEGHG